MKKWQKSFLVVILVGMTVLSLAGCGNAQAETPKNQTATVQRGSLTVDITAAGNLAFSHWEDLAFQVSSTQTEPITVDEVKVTEGDSVKEGQVLVTVDTKALKDKVTTRERALKQAQLQVKNAEMAVTSAEMDFQTAQNAEQQTIRVAEIALETATDNYRKISYPYTAKTFAVDIPAAITAIHDAEIQLEKATTGLGKEPSSAEYGDVQHQITLAKENLAQARQGMSLGVDPELFKGGREAPLAVGDVWSLRAAQFSIEQAQISLDKAKESFQSGVDKAQLSLDKARVSMDQSKLSLEVAQEDLNTAKADLDKATIIAPFAGFVSKVNVKGGDEVKQGTVAVQVADPNKFEAEIMASEMDIAQVKLNGKATVQPTALPTLTVPAKVTAISPTATIQSGVVNYKVKVEIESLEGVPADFQFRQGLTVTVSIILQQKANVLLVPYTAITSQGGQSYVQVVSATGTLEKRAIKTGITDYKNTEVTEGLREGEKVSIPQSTKTTTTTQQQSPGGIMIPGVGGGPPPGGSK